MNSRHRLALERWTVAMVCGTALVTALRCFYAANVELAPQEAYYWQYSRHLALSYFDHPPMAAWLIAVSTRLLGHSELAVRLPAIVGGAVMTLLLYRLTRRLYDARAAALAAFLSNCTVLFGLGAVIVTPDAPLALCWIAAMGTLAELLLPNGKGPGSFGWRWLVLGVWCGLGLLSKYTAGLLLLQILLTALATPEGRKALRTPGPYCGLLLSLTIFSPVLIWNARNGWASILFQSTGRVETVRGFQSHLLGRYLGLQALALGPLLYIALAAQLRRICADAWRGKPAARFLALASLPGLVLFTAVSPWHWVKLNWVGPSYLGLLIFAAASWSAPGLLSRARWLVPTTVVSAGLTLALYLMPVLPQIPFRDRDDLVNGWHELAFRVWAEEQKVSNGGPLPQIIGWGYKAASELAFYLPGHPLTLSASSLGGPGLAYAYWTATDTGASTDAIVIADDREPLLDADSRLLARCGSVLALPDARVHRGTHEITRFKLWRCEHWQPQRIPDYP